MKRLTYLSPKTEVKKSAIQGEGLFAKTVISAGEIIAIKGGYILSEREWRELESSLGSAEIQITDDMFIAPSKQSEREGSMLYTNHSCEPNIGIQGQIVFMAMRNIDAGEELTHDWATTDHEDDFEMSCNCGTMSCRKIITGKDWQKPGLQKKYAGWFSWYLERKINQRH